jgi:hypothetical protein
METSLKQQPFYYVKHVAVQILKWNQTKGIKEENDRL